MLANGLNIGLRHTLGMTREVISTCHSISIGFDVEPVGRPSFEFRALTYYPEQAADRMAYLTLFPVTPATMRANLFVYRDMHDPWLRQMRDAPVEALFALMPGLRKFIGQIAVPDHVKIRPVDLYVTDGHRQAGVVLVGDAFATSCPAAGTGCNKVFTDVERLCNVHIPRWLASDGHGRGEDRGILRRPREARLRCRIHREGLLPALAVDRRRVALAGAALGPLRRPGRDRGAPSSARAAAGSIAGPAGSRGRQQGLALTMNCPDSVRAGAGYWNYRVANLNPRRTLSFFRKFRTVARRIPR